MIHQLLVNVRGAKRDMESATIQALTERILRQRMSRYTDSGLDLTPFGSARCRQDGPRLLVAFATARPGLAAQVVERVRDYARSRRQYLVWTVVPQAAGETEFPVALRACGFALDERLILMGRQGPVEDRRSPQTQVEPLTTWEAMLAYERGSRLAFHDEADPDDRYTVARARERWRQQEQGWYRYYVARIGGQSVGGCYVSLWEDIPTVMGVYTMPHARHSGVASALLARATQELARSGRDTTCLYVKAGNPAHSLYMRLGYSDLATEETYLASGQVVS